MTSGARRGFGVSNAIRKPKPTGGATAVHETPSSAARLRTLRTARARLHEATRDALATARAPALLRVRAAAAAAHGRPDVVAVTLRMRAAAACGDRCTAFDAAVDAMVAGAGEGAVVVRLAAAWHASVPAVLGKLEEIWDGMAQGSDGEESAGEGRAGNGAVKSWEEGGRERPAVVVVAFEDADRFPENVLRDVVYLCGQRHREMFNAGGGSTQAVSMLFGVSLSGDCVHSALGVTEATMIAPITIAMPSAEACFHAVVHRVLCDARHPIVLSAPVFRMIRDEFRLDGSSVSMLERALDSIYTLQYWNGGTRKATDLTAVFANPDTLPAFLNGGSGSKSRGAGKESVGFVTSANGAAGDAVSPSSPDESHACTDYGPEFSGGANCSVTKLLTGELCQQLITSPPSVTDVLDPDLVEEGGLVDEEMRKALTSHPINDKEREALFSEKLSVDRICGLAEKWHADICSWRWRSRVVQEVVWELADHLGVASDGGSDPAGWNTDCGSQALAPLARQRLRTLLYEEFLPGAIDIETQRHVCNRVASRLSKCGDAPLAVILESWRACLQKHMSAGGPSLESEGLQSIIDGIQALQAEYEDGDGDKAPDLEPFLAAGYDVKDAEIEKNEACATLAQTMVGEKRKSTRNTFDNAIVDAEVGKARVNRIARGSGAAFAKRKKKYQEASTRAAAESAPLKRAQQSALSLFKRMLRLLGRLQDLPLHEVTFFDDVEALRKSSGGMGIHAEPRASYFQCLRNPGELFKLNQEDLDNDKNIPDISLAYRLLSECGQFVNLASWYNAYQSMRGMASGLMGAATAGSVVDDAASAAALGTQAERITVRSAAEFVNLVPELEFLGFLKHTKRRADHVVRLVFE